MRQALIRLGLMALVFVGCLRSDAMFPRAMSSAVGGCPLGDPLPPLASIQVAGYPVKPPLWEDAARREATSALERKVPGWTLVLDERGVPVRATLPIAGVTPAQRLDRVRALFAALGANYRLSSPLVIELRGDQVEISSNDAAWSARVVGDALVVGTNSPIHRFDLPATAHELTDGELYVRWGGHPRSAVVVIAPESVQCEPGGPHQTCSQPSPRQACVPIFKAIRRAEIKTPTGFRRVVRFEYPGCEAGTHPPCEVQSRITCTDTVTGEVLGDACDAVPPP